MKVLSAEQIRQADAFTIKNEPVSSVDLMERAASRCTEWICRNMLDFQPPQPIHVICGIGNNGGDGLVIARKLAEKDFAVYVHILEFSDKHSEDFDVNLERLKNTEARVHFYTSEDPKPDLKDAPIIVDAIFGTGLGRPVKGWIGEWIVLVNDRGQFIISVDIPSGLYSDDNRENNGAIVQANHTLTFQVPKLAFFCPQNAKYVGEWHILDIGLHPDILRDLETKYWFADADIVRGIPQPRKKFSHKGDYGHALLVGGSKGMMGAMVLATKACLRSGAGLVTTKVPGCGLDILQISCPEAMCTPDENIDHISGAIPHAQHSAVGIGPGLGSHEDSARMLKNFIHDSNLPKVIDADALNILSENKTWLSFLKGPTIITPHPGEFRRLAGSWDSDEQKLELQIEFARKHNCVVVLKGAHTSTIFPDGQVFFNSTGNPGMATGGVGDMLTGILTGLLAQGYSPGKAAILGVYLHGKAGDLTLLDSETQPSLLPGNMIDHLGRAWETLGVR